MDPHAKGEDPSQRMGRCKASRGITITACGEEGEWSKKCSLIRSSPKAGGRGHERFPRTGEGEELLQPSNSSLLGKRRRGGPYLELSLQSDHTEPITEHG